MKNMMVVDGSTNCAYTIYQLTDEAFKEIFPLDGQDIEFIDDVVARLDEDAIGKALGPAWKRPVCKPDVVGIHGTLFYNVDFAREHYPNKRQSDVDASRDGWVPTGQGKEAHLGPHWDVQTPREYPTYRIVRPRKKEA